MRRLTTPFQIIFIVTVLLFYLSSNKLLIQLNSINSFVSINSPRLQNYVLHDPISIFNDTQLAEMANSGVGTPENPFIITNLHIESSTTYGILITKTTQYFRIENCWIEGRTNMDSGGIIVNDVTSGTASIVNNICNNNKRDGITVTYSDSVTLVNNTCEGNIGIGIYLYESQDSILSNNNCKKNALYGIYLESSSISVINNTCISNLGDGIRLREAAGSSVVSNNCTHNGLRGISIRDSPGVSITENICIYNNLHGIRLLNSRSSLITQNICSMNGEDGLYIQYSPSSTVKDNTCNENERYGIYLHDSHSSDIDDNTCLDNAEGDIFDTDNPLYSTSRVLETTNYSLIFTRILLFFLVCGLLFLCFFFFLPRSKSV